jgi:hypothetical protein
VQTLLVVGTGTHEVLVVDFVVLLLLVGDAEQVYTLVEIVGLGLGPLGGYLALH